MDEIYSTALFSHSTATPFLRSLFNPLFNLTKIWFLGILNPKHPKCKGFSSNSSFILWIFWSTSWSEVIAFQAKICWNRHQALKWLIHRYIFSLYWGRNSRNILTWDVHFLNTCTTSCWWHVWFCCMTVILDEDDSFCGSGNLKSGKQKTRLKHQYWCTQKKTNA